MTTLLLSLPCPSVWAANSVSTYWKSKTFLLIYSPLYFFFSRQMALVNEDLPEKENNDILEIYVWVFDEIFHFGFFFKIVSDYFFNKISKDCKKKNSFTEFLFRFLIEKFGICFRKSLIFQVYFHYIHKRYRIHHLTFSHYPICNVNNLQGNYL